MGGYRRGGEECGTNCKTLYPKSSVTHVTATRMKASLISRLMAGVAICDVGRLHAVELSPGHRTLFIP